MVARSEKNIFVSTVHEVDVNDLDFLNALADAITSQQVRFRDQRIRGYIEE